MNSPLENRQKTVSSGPGVYQVPTIGAGAGGGAGGHGTPTRQTERPGPTLPAARSVSRSPSSSIWPGRVPTGPRPSGLSEKVISNDDWPPGT
jgi:hypothetical protein